VTKSMRKSHARSDSDASGGCTMSSQKKAPR
jgi:hypothetical protein